MKDPLLQLETRLEALEPAERQRFLTYFRTRMRRDLLLLMFAMPALFIAGWLPAAIAQGLPALESLALRIGLCAALVATACLLLPRRLRRWEEVVLMAYLAVFGIAIAITTFRDPTRMSLIHVVVALLLIVWLRFAVRPSTVAGTVVALTTPVIAVMASLEVQPMVWISYGTFCIVGLWIALASRGAQMEAWLELFLLRGRLLERLHEDALTGAANREAWHSNAVRQHAVAMRGGHGACVIFFDLDRFKSINDRHGHAAGDAILQQVATVMTRNLRQNEVLARLGGEEFVALLPGVTLANAGRIAERIRREIAAIPGPIPVTVSAGVACAEPGESLDRVTARADEAMLMAKRNGRDRIELARPVRMEAG